MVSNRVASSAVAEREPQLEPTQPGERASRKGSALAYLRGISEQTKLRLKLLFSVLMIGALFTFGKIDISRSIQLATQANLFYLGGAAALFLLSTVMNAYRWQLLASAVGFPRPLLQLTKFCFVGNFFNLFLPSTVGGDFSRCYYLSKGTGRYHHAFYSVIADRVVGISVLFLFASLGILLGPGGETMPWHLKAPIFAGTLAIFALVPVAPLLTRRVLGEEHSLSKRINNSVAQVYWRDRQLIGISLLLSIVMQVMIVVCHILVGLSLRLTSIPLWYYFIFYPSVAVLGFVTPSFNGIGIREWSYTYFLTMMGVDRSHAVTYAMLWLGLITFNSLVGGLVYALGHMRMPQQEPEKLQYDTI